VQCVLSFS